jgi:hypothetical protein
MLIQALAILATALFTGAAVYVTFVEHPARLACPTEVALAQWRRSYPRGTLMQARRSPCLARSSASPRGS